MSEPKWTPGPWVFAVGQPYVTRDWNGKQVAVACVVPPLWHEDNACANREAGANAHLIAAAPALYEALRMCLLNGNLDEQERGMAEAALSQVLGSSSGGRG